MDHMVLVIDESGAKGYANKGEQEESDVGVMAGFIYTRLEMLDIETTLQKILSSHNISINNKIHITELNNSNSLRESFFNAFQERKLQWFFRAIYSEGFHQSEFKEDRGGDFNEKASLHVELFRQMFLYSLSMAASVNKKNLNILVVTDTIDTSILKKFTREAEHIAKIFMNVKRNYFHYVKNEKTGKFEKKKFNVLTTSDSIPKFESIQFKIICKTTPLTLAADILANSVYFYLKKNKKGKSSHLNNINAISGHPLANSAFIQKDENDELSLIDIVYRRER